MNWEFLPVWSLRVIALVAVVLAGVALTQWRRERRGGKLLVLRLAMLAGILVVVLNPQALVPRERAGKPRFVVLVDSSASMATRDAGGDSRWAAVAKALGGAGVLDAMNREFIPEFRSFDRSVRPADPARLGPNAPAGDATDLGAALMSVVSDLGDAKSQAGVLLVSDGRATTPGALEAAQLALARSVPLWTWCVGGPSPRRDLWISTASSEALAFSGAEVELAATLHADGYANRSFKVELLREGKVVETREVLPGTNGTAPVSMRVKAPAAGEERWVFRAAPQPEESDTANNERAVFLRSVGDKARGACRRRPAALGLQVFGPGAQAGSACGFDGCLPGQRRPDAGGRVRHWNGDAQRPGPVSTHGGGNERV